MTRDEFARIGGFSSDSNLHLSDNKNKSAYSRVDSFQVGRELNVNEIYNRLISQQRVAERLNDAAKNLRAIADLTECVSPALELLTGQSEVKPS